jgi:hypothetical protein
MGDYISKDERLRRIGELLLRGIYLWAEATVGAEPTPTADRRAGVDGTGIVDQETDQASVQDVSRQAHAPRRVAVCHLNDEPSRRSKSPAH